MAGLALYESYNSKTVDSTNHTIQLARKILNRKKFKQAIMWKERKYWALQNFLKEKTKPVK